MIPDAELPVEVFQSAVKRPCRERALVLQALGIPHRVHHEGGGYHLLVPSSQASRASQELGLYSEENVGWPPPRQLAPLRSTGVRGSLIYATLVVLLFPIGREGLLGRNWWEAGKLVAGRVLDGEWWRTVTALTLHGGASHLIGNLVFGCAFAVLASHTLGAGLTWFGTLLAGALGNLLDAAVQNRSHSAIGASTAVFGCLGLMMSYEWVRRHALHLPLMRRLAPMMAGAVLLGFLGTGGGASQEALARTDVVAHVMGLLVGVGLGWVIGRTRLPERLGKGSQMLLGVLSLAIVVLAWVAALS